MMITDLIWIIYFNISLFKVVYNVYYLRTIDKTENLLKQENVHSGELTARSLEFQQLEEQYDLLKTAMEMASGKQMLLDSYIIQLYEQIDAKRHNLIQIVKMVIFHRNAIACLSSDSKNALDSFFLFVL